MNEKERIQRRMNLEQELQYRLSFIIDQIKQREINQTSDAQRIYGNKTEGIIRKAVTDAYDLGAEYVNDKLHFSIITPQELERESREVNEQTVKYTDIFWRKVGMVMHRNDTLLQKNHYEPRSPLNSNYLATVTAVGIVTTSMAMGTKTKLQLLGSQFKSAKKKKKKPITPLTDKQMQEDDLQPVETTTPIDDILNALPLALTASMIVSQQNSDDSDVNDPLEVVETKSYQLQWNAILDNVTCVICESLDGTVWYPDDPSLPTPGDDGDIHANCRCFYDIIESEEDLFEAL